MSLGCKPTEKIWLGGKFFQEVAGAGTHGACAGMDGGFKQLFYLAAQSGVVLRKVGEGLEREGLYDGAAVFEVSL